MDTTTPDDRDLEASLGAIRTARTYPELLGSLGATLSASTDQLFIVDHDVSQIRFLDHDRTIDLTGELGAALRESKSCLDGDGWWLPIVEGDAVVLGVLYDEEPDERAATHLRRVAGLVGMCTATLRSRFEDVDQRRRRRNMSVAAELQWGLLPTRADSAGGFSFASLLAPAYDVAGDLFDYSWSDDSLWVYSLDAMGHGLEATMSGVVALTAIRNSRREGADLVEQLTHANSEVQRQWRSERFVTAIGCRLGGGDIEVVNAGHEPLRRRTGESVMRLEIPTSIPLGIDLDTTYSSHTIPALQSDESLVLLSDGSSEARNADGAAFGAAAVDLALSGVGTSSPQHAAHAYLRRVTDHVGDQPIGDDITVVVVSTEEQPGSA